MEIQNRRDIKLQLFMLDDNINWFIIPYASVQLGNADEYEGMPSLLYPAICNARVKHNGRKVSINTRENVVEFYKMIRDLAKE